MGSNSAPVLKKGLWRVGLPSRTWASGLWGGGVALRAPGEAVKAAVGLGLSWEDVRDLLVSTCVLIF